MTCSAGLCKVFQFCRGSCQLSCVLWIRSTTGTLLAKQWNNFGTLPKIRFTVCEGSYTVIATIYNSVKMSTSCIFYSATTTQDGVAPETKKGADILSSLFEEANDICASSNISQAIDAHPHSTNVYCIPASQRWRLQSAYVHGNALIVFLRSSVKFMLLNVYHASSYTQFDEQRMPIFSSHPLFSHEINSCCGPLNRLNQKSTEDTADLIYIPAFSLLCCQSAWKSGSTSLLTPIADVLFQQLFGVEFLLAQSTVALGRQPKWHNFVP